MNSRKNSSLLKRAGWTVLLLHTPNSLGMDLDSSKLGYGASVLAAGAHLSGKGIDFINARLGNSTVLNVKESYGNSVSWGSSLSLIDPKMDWNSQLCFEQLEKKISASGTGTQLSSSLNFNQLNGFFGWRVYPRKNIDFDSLAKKSTSERFYAFAGPSIGIGWLTYRYQLTSRLDDTIVAYDSSSALLLLGGEGLIGFSVLKNVHMGLFAKLRSGWPYSTNTHLGALQVSGADVRYKAATLNIPQSTSSLLLISIVGTNVTLIL